MSPKTERGLVPESPEPVRFAFDEMNLQKVRINVFDYNERAKHVLASNGFVQEGKLVREFYRDGEFHDLVILSRLREQP